MDPDSAALSRERAASSEPCSTRPNPFDDNNGPAARKRQRTSRGGSRSRSVDTATAMDTTPDSMPSVEESPGPELDAAPPRTPSSPTQGSSPEPTSSKVTINLRTAPPRGSISSPRSPTPPSKMAPGSPEDEARQSIESGSDELSTIPAGESPSSSSMAPESPEIEVVTINEDGEEFANRSPPLAIIDEDELFVDPILNFPYNGDGESLANTVKRLAHFIQFGMHWPYLLCLTHAELSRTHRG
jgi:ubiquitin carboxyl-terminal hydrolase 34